MGGLIKPDKQMEKAIGLLNDANFEIRKLRRENELMRARLEMFDSINAILHTKPAEQSMGMSPDLTWEIQKFIDAQPKVA